MKYPIIFTVPQTFFDPTTGKGTFVGDLTVIGHSTRYRCDGTTRTVDIDSVIFGSENVTNYISACQPEKWDELIKVAEQHAKSLNNEPIETKD
jgi:hypothetical protein